MNKLSLDKKKAVVACLVDGASINATVRMTGVSKPTILKLVRDLGAVCRAYHDTHVRGLKPERIQTDEIWAFIGAKAKNVKPTKAIEGWGDVWTYTAITEKKLILAYRVSQRTQEDSDEFMLDVAGRITQRTQLTTDGHTTYLNAVANAFEFEVDYAQLVKTYGGSQGNEARTAAEKYSPPRINGARKIGMIGLPETKHISTSHVERSNLTMRISMRRFTQLTNAHSKKISYHANAVALFFSFYNFCRVHSTIETSPAVASGLINHVWSIEELLNLAD